MRTGIFLGLITLAFVLAVMWLAFEASAPGSGGKGTLLLGSVLLGCWLCLAIVLLALRILRRDHPPKPWRKDMGNGQAMGGQHYVSRRSNGALRFASFPDPDGAPVDDYEDGTETYTLTSPSTGQDQPARAKSRLTVVPNDPPTASSKPPAKPE